MIKITEAVALISLMSHTLGSIGQIVKDASTLKESYTKEQAHDEIKRIYDGYINAVTKLIGTPKTNE